MEIQEGTLSKIAYLLILLVWLIGGALTGVGVYLYLETVEIGTCINDELAALMIVLVAVGGVLLITAFFGLCGVCKKRSSLLSGFLAAMIIVLLAQFAAVVIMFIFESSIHYFMRDGMTHSLLFYGKGGDNVKFTDSWDYVQENHKCCGQFGWEDYTTPNASNWFSTKFGSLPDSCCKTKEAKCGEGVIDKKDIKKAPGNINPKGCYDIVEDYAQQWLTIAGSAALVFMFIQVIAIFLNISLHRRYREHEDYQTQSRKVKQVKDANNPEKTV